MTKVRITLVKGINRRKPNHIKTVKALGLSKINQSVEHNLTCLLYTSPSPRD